MGFGGVKRGTKRGKARRHEGTKGVESTEPRSHGGEERYGGPQSPGIHVGSVWRGAFFPWVAYGVAVEGAWLARGQIIRMVSHRVPPAR